MEIGLLVNGLHSLNKGYSLVQEYEVLSNEDENKFFLLKDIVLAIHHGIEILFKESLRKKNELLIFSNLDKSVKNMYKEKKQKKIEDIFLTNGIKDVHMITYEEAIERMEIFYDVELEKDFKKNLLELNKYRNIITHSSLLIETTKVLETIYGIAQNLDFYLEEVLQEEYEIKQGYINLKNILNKVELYNKNIKLYKCIVKILKKEKINVGLGEAVCIEDINKAYNFLNSFLKEGYYMGTDVINGFCSGKITKITRTKEEFNIYIDDNGSIYNFVFKGLLVVIPPLLDSNESPLFFLESSLNEAYEKIDKKYILNIPPVRIVEEIYFPKSKKKFFAREIYEEEVNIPDETYERIYHFIDEKMLLFLNIQEFEYGLGRYLINKIKDESMEEIKKSIIRYYEDLKKKNNFICGS